MTTSGLFRAIRAECDRLHLDDSTVVVDAPLEDCEAGWCVGLTDQSDDTLIVGSASNCFGSTLDEALGAMLGLLRDCPDPK